MSGSNHVSFPRMMSGSVSSIKASNSFPFLLRLWKLIVRILRWLPFAFQFSDLVRIFGMGDEVWNTPVDVGLWMKDESHPELVLVALVDWEMSEMLSNNEGFRDTSWFSPVDGCSTSRSGTSYNILELFGLLQLGQNHNSSDLPSALSSADVMPIQSL